MIPARNQWSQPRAILLVTVAMSFMVGCGGYDSVSPVAYQYAKALVSISNRQAAKQLPALQEQLQRSHEAGELSDRELKWLSTMVADAESGRWTETEAAARQLMMDQVQQGSP